MKSHSLTLLGHPKTGPRRTLPTAKQRKDLGRQRRYPVLGRPSSWVWNNFNPMGTMINLLNLTDTTRVFTPKWGGSKLPARLLPLDHSHIWGGILVSTSRLI